MNQWGIDSFLTRCLRCLHALQACATRLRLSAGTLGRVIPDTTVKVYASKIIFVSLYIEGTVSAKQSRGVDVSSSVLQKRLDSW
jgi:hypothetical protein